jgi:hypothetical protein
MAQQAMELSYSGLLVSLPFGLIVMALSVGASLSVTGLLFTSGFALVPILGGIISAIEYLGRVQ